MCTFLMPARIWLCCYRKSFGVMIGRICRAFIIKLLMIWYRNQKQCIKWDSVLSDTFFVCNGINKLFNIDVNTLSIRLDEQYIWRCLNVNTVTRIYYTDALVFSSTAGMNGLLKGMFTDFWKFGLKLSEQKTVLLHFTRERLIKPETPLNNDTVIKMEWSCR